MSSDPSRRQDVFRMSEFLIDELKALGAINVETRDPGQQDFHGTPLPLPPIVLATVGNDPAKKTILVYGHYDVQPVSYFFSFPCYDVVGRRERKDECLAGTGYGVCIILFIKTNQTLLLFLLLIINRLCWKMDGILILSL